MKASSSSATFIVLFAASWCTVAGQGRSSSIRGRGRRTEQVGSVELTAFDSQVDPDLTAHLNEEEPANLNLNNCLQDSWDGFGKDGDLVCTTKEVFLESITTPEPMSCTLGEMVTVTVSASIHFDSSRYDLGWYVAADAGDALEGTCIVNGLHEDYEYDVVTGPGRTTQAGFVSWGQDFAGANDSCGDVFVVGAGGGNIDIPFLVNTPMRCSDENEDGKMDLSVCFTWRSEETDDFCTLVDSDLDNRGILADLYPGNNSMCYCESYDVPSITVVDTSKSSADDPCASQVRAGAGETSR